MHRYSLKFFCFGLLFFSLTACVPSKAIVQIEPETAQVTQTNTSTTSAVTQEETISTCYYKVSENQNRVLALKDPIAPPFKDSNILDQTAQPLDTSLVYLPLIIYDIQTGEEIALDYLVVEDSGTTIEESYDHLNIYYEDQYAKFLSKRYACVVALNSSINNAIIHKRDLQDFNYDNSGTTENPHTLQLDYAERSRLLFDIEQLSYSLVWEDETDEAQWNSTKYHYLPSEVSKHDRIYYNKVCSDAKLKDFFFDMSVQDVINKLGEPISLTWLPGFYLEYPEYGFFCEPTGDTQDNQGVTKPTLTTTSGMLYQGKGAVMGLKIDMGLQEVMDVLGYLPEITSDYDTEYWANYFYVYQDKFRALFALDHNCKIEQIMIMRFDENTDEAIKVGKVKTDKESFYNLKGKIDFPFTMYTPDEIYEDSWGSSLLFNDDGFYFFENSMTMPKKLSDQPMLFLYRDMFSEKRSVIALGKNDHCFYQLFLDDATQKQLTTKPFTFD